MILINIMLSLFGASSSRLSKKKGKILSTFTKVQNDLEQVITQEEDHCKTLVDRRSRLEAEINQMTTSVESSKRTLEKFKNLLS